MTAVQAGKGPARDSVLLGKYRVEATLGFGGMGLVIRAHNLPLDEKVAIKFLREDVQLEAEHVTRFLREAKAAVRLKSEHVAKIRDVGTLEDGRPFIVMELLEGLDLGKLLIDHGSIEPRRAVDLMLQACDAIAEAHSLGIVHRDIKPTNLFVTKRRDGTELLKVLDFGISKAQAGPEMSLTQTSSMLGTPAYMSPEQMRSARTVDARSDIWAIGTVLYELVEGRLPFEATNFAELCVMVSTEPHARPVNAPQLEAVIDRCLAKSVDERFQDVGELAAALEPFASEPQLAQRQVRRILRVLGKAVAMLDATPIPRAPSAQNIPFTPSPTGTDLLPFAHMPSHVDRTPLPDPGSAPDARPFAPAPTVMPELRRSSIWKPVLLLLVLFGVGVAGGLIVTGSSDSVGSSPPAAADSDDNELAGGGSATGDMAVIDAGAAPPGAAVDARRAPLGAPSDAGAASPDAASQRTPAKTIERPVTKRPPRKPPPRKPPPRKPPPRKPPPESPEQPEKLEKPDPAPVPAKKCDPFDNPKGC